MKQELFNPTIEEELLSQLGIVEPESFIETDTFEESIGIGAEERARFEDAMLACERPRSMSRVGEQMGEVTKALDKFSLMAASTNEAMGGFARAASRAWSISATMMLPNESIPMLTTQASEEGKPKSIVIDNHDGSFYVGRGYVTALMVHEERDMMTERTKCTLDLMGVGPLTRSTAQPVSHHDIVVPRHADSSIEFTQDAVIGHAPVSIAWDNAGERDPAWLTKYGVMP